LKKMNHLIWRKLLDRKRWSTSIGPIENSAQLEIDIYGVFRLDSRLF